VLSSQQNGPLSEGTGEGINTAAKLSARVDSFLAATTATDQLRIIVEMTKEKSLVRLAKTDEFRQGLVTLTSRLDSQGDEQVAAIIALSRIASSVRLQRDSVNDLLANGIKNPPTGILSLNSPEDRSYVLTACRAGQHEWAASFFANILVLEEHADQTREEAARGVIQNTPDLKSAIQLVFNELHLLRIETNSLAKRLRRTLGAIRIAGSELNPIPGDDVGKCLADHIYKLFRSIGPPTSSASRKELLIEVADLVHELVRSRFSQATLAETYEVLRVLRGWYDSREWEALVPDVDSLRHVARDLSEAISLLARANVTDDRLISILPVVTGSESNAAVLRHALAVETIGLTDDVRTWLSGLPSRKRSDTAEESQQRHADAYIADLLVRVWSQGQMQFQKERVPDDVVEMVKALANARSLVMSADAGRIVEFSALEHEVVGGFSPGLRYVRILQPSVRAVFADGRTRTVRKSLAEPANKEVNL
jgi:hypothetical protein